MLQNFKTAFENTYQEFFPKVLVAMKIANTRLEAGLTYGQSVTRVRYDISNVNVQDVVNHTDMSIDPITDSAENLTVNLHKGVAFPLAAQERVQAGPLNPGTVIGAMVARKLAAFIDADVLYETLNAAQTFDNGDLTTLASSGTPITITSTTTPQMVTRLPAKLRRNNQELSNLALVLDSYGIADMFQYLLGKNADFVNALFQNGYVNQEVASAEVFVSENLTGEGTLTTTGTFSDGETITINGVVLTMKTTLGSTAGQVLIGADAAHSLTNLASIINGTAGAGSTYIELATADRKTITSTLRIAATATTTAIRVVGTGSGRLTLAETAANASWNGGNNSGFIHAYFGKKGRIDVVIQRDVKGDQREEPKQPGTVNILSDVLYGKKTFYDGSQGFLDVQISA
jgi:hypothetical protein